MKHRFKYEYVPSSGRPRHTWSVVGAKGGIHLTINDNGESASHQWDRYSGGLEVHWRTPPEYKKDDAPDHDNCWLLNGPCWRDGSSLEASERWIPFWIAGKHLPADEQHARMFGLLSAEYEDVLNREEDDD